MSPLAPRAGEDADGVWVENPTATQLEKEQLFLKSHPVSARPVSASAIRMFHPSCSSREQELLAKLMSCQAALVMRRNDLAISSTKLRRSGAPTHPPKPNRVCRPYKRSLETLCVISGGRGCWLWVGQTMRTRRS
jgi:hypothetical protein